MEHVRHRRKYLESVNRNLAPDGRFLINYDAGHFVTPGPLRPGTDRWQNLLSPIKAMLGYEKSYQSFVREREFKSLAQIVGLKIIDEKMFNTDLKTVYQLVPPEQREQFMARWLELELYLNSMGITYTDSMAPVFRTRNFIMTHADALA
jgi:SAM-dependent methyltransferase